jgi:hypothetical protein
MIYDLGFYVQIRKHRAGISGKMRGLPRPIGIAGPEENIINKLLRYGQNCSVIQWSARTAKSLKSTMPSR